METRHAPACTQVLCTFGFSHLNPTHTHPSNALVCHLTNKVNSLRLRHRSSLQCRAPFLISDNQNSPSDRIDPTWYDIVVWWPSWSVLYSWTEFDNRQKCCHHQSKSVTGQGEISGRIAKVRKIRAGHKGEIFLERIFGAIAMATR